MARAELIVTLTPGTIQTGLWCDDCNLPSRVRVPINHITTRGVSTLVVVDRCQECGHRA